MRRCSVIGIVILLLLLLFVFCGCGEEQTPESVYKSYMELGLEDTAKAKREYVYFKNQELEYLAFNSGKSVMYDYRIDDWEQLSDQLWVFYVTIHNDYEPEPYEIINFVAMIDGKYWVITGLAGLTDELKEGVDFSRLKKYEGEIAMEEVLKQ